MLSTWRKGYKVVLRTATPDIYLSSISEYCYTYEKNKPTKKLNSGPLAVFTDIHNAVMFAGPHESVFECWYVPSIERCLWYNAKMENGGFYRCERNEDFPESIDFADVIILKEELIRK